MRRINPNDLEKAEGLPSKLSIRKSILKDTGGVNYKITTTYDLFTYRRRRKFWKQERRIMRRYVGLKWEEVREKIKAILPEELHSWIHTPDTIQQDKSTGKWYFVDSYGRFDCNGFDTPKELKEFNRWPRFYLNKDGILKYLPSKRRLTKGFSKNKSDLRKQKRDIKQEKYFNSLADYTNSNTRLGEIWNISIGFHHPTKRVPKKIIKDGKWTEDPTQLVPLYMNLTLKEFEQFAKANNKTYYFTVKDKVYTNLK